MHLKNAEMGYLGNPQVKRDGVQQQFTKDEVSEYLKCMKDPIYFAKTYVKVISLDRGLVPFKPYSYQEKMFSHFTDNRFSIVLACRQSVSQLARSSTFFGTLYSNPTRQLPSLPIKAPRRVKCWHVLHWVLKTYHSFYNQAVEH